MFFFISQRVDPASLFEHAAEIIYLSEVIIQVKQQLHQDVADRPFRTVENQRVLGLHLLRSERVQGFADHRNERLQLSHEIFPWHALLEKFLVAVSNISGASKCRSDKVIRAPDDM